MNKFKTAPRVVQAGIVFAFLALITSCSQAVIVKGYDEGGVIYACAVRSIAFIALAYGLLRPSNTVRVIWGTLGGTNLLILLARLYSSFTHSFHYLDAISSASEILIATSAGLLFLSPASAFYSELPFDTPKPEKQEGGSELARASKVGFLITGILIAAWPIISFGAIFIFDAPMRSMTDEVSRYLFAFSIFLYPLIWNLARKKAEALLDDGDASLLKITGLVATPVLIPLLAFLALLAVAPR